MSLAPYVAVAAVVLTACTAAPTDPYATFADRDAAPSRRLRALDRLPDDERTLVAMHHILWDDGQPTDLRLATADRLVAADEQGFQQAAADRLARVDRWEVLAPLCRTIAAERWRSLTPALIQSWARPSTQYPDASRPEAAAIAAMHRDVAVDQVLWGAMATDPVPVGAAAWTVLCRTTPRDALVGQLMRQAPATPLLADLLAAWRDLGVLPRNRQQVLWLMHLRGSAPAQRWELARRQVAMLDAAQRQGLQLRHVAVLTDVGLYADPPDRATWMASIEKKLAAAVHHQRTGSDTSVIAARGESFAQARDGLAWADLVVLDVLTSLLGQPDIRAALFEQADADLADTSSEHGGVVVMEQWRAQLRAYPPAITGNDQAFYAPPELITAMYTALAHYHFHANRHDNAAFAGPGGGDLAFADRFGAACVVFTFIDRDTLNVDYHHEGGVVIDLGCISRPQ